MAENWYEKAKEKIGLETPLVSKPLTKAPEPKDKSFLESTGEVVGGVAGTAIGTLGEIGQFGISIPSSVKEWFDPDTDTWKEFVKEVEDVRKGLGPRPEDVKSGTARVFQGLISPQGPRGPTSKKGKLEDTPIYDALKRDALNIGEGLVDLGATAIGFNREALQRAQKGMEEDKRPTSGFMAGVERGGRAGIKAGEELAGGLLGTGLFFTEATRELFSSGQEGKKLYREAPLTTALNLLPVLDSLGSSIKRGRLSSAQVAEVNKLVGNTKNPKTGKPFTSLDELTDTLKEIKDKVDRGETPTPKEAGLVGAMPEGGIPSFGEVARRAATAVEETTATKVGSALKTAVSRAPYVAAGYSVGGLPGAIVAGGLVYGGKLLDAFSKTGAGKKVGATKAAKFAGRQKRGFVEPRTYETPQAEAVGEQALTTAGEVKVAETQLGDFASTMEGSYDVRVAPEIPQPVEVPKVESKFTGLATERAGIQERLRQAKELAKQNQDPQYTQTYEDAVRQVEGELKQNQLAIEAEAGADVLRTELETKTTQLQREIDTATQMADSLRNQPNAVALTGENATQIADRIKQLKQQQSQLKTSYETQIGDRVKQAKETALQQAKEATTKAETAEQGRVAVAMAERARQSPIEQQVPLIQQAGEFVVNEEGITKGLEQPAKEKRLVIDPEGPNNKRNFDELKSRLKGTQFGEGYLAEADTKRLFASIIASREIPTLMLLNPELRTKVIELIERRIGKKFVDEGRKLIDQQLTQIGEEVFGDPRMVEQQGRAEKTAGVPTITGRDYTIRIGPTGERIPLFELANRAAAEIKISPESIVLDNFFKHYQKKLLTTGGRSIPLGGYAGDLTGFTMDFDKAVQSGDRAALAAAILQANETGDFLRSVSDKQKTLDALNKELIDPTNTFPEYLKMVKDLRDQVEMMSKSKEGPYTYESVSNLPVERAFIPETQTNLANEIAGKTLGGFKRMLTAYNPAVIFGNYLGNTFVESLSTGKTPPEIIVSQALEARRFADRVKEARKTGTLSLTDDIALRAIPKVDLTFLETGGGFELPTTAPDTAGLARKGVAKVGAAVEGGLKGFRTIYDYGDRMPKTAEAIKQSTNLIERINSAPENTTFALQTGPNLFVYATKSPNGMINIINPRTGTIVGSGTINSPAIKRVLGSAVKQAVDTKFPDVSQLPNYYQALARANNLPLKVASAIVFAPFLSYVLKAGDSPYRKGIFGNILTMSNNPILFETSQSKGLYKNIGQLWDQSSMSVVGDYLRSRGLVNSFFARYNDYSQDERKAIRDYLNSLPTDQKSVVLGELIKLEDGRTTRQYTTPSYATFFSMTDNYARSIMAISRMVGGLTGKTAEQVGKEAGSQNIVMDKILAEVSSGKQPDLGDIAKAFAIAGGIWKEDFLKLVDFRQNAPVYDPRESFLKKLGLISKLYDINFGDKKIYRNADNLNNTLMLITDVITGSVIMDPKANDTRIKQQIKQIYEMEWNNLIKPGLDKALELENQGKYSEAAKIINQLDNLNEGIKSVVEKQIEARVAALKKLGIEPELKTQDFKKVWRKVQDPEATQKVKAAPTEEERPTPKDEDPFVREKGIELEGDEFRRREE